MDELSDKRADSDGIAFPSSLIILSINTHPEQDFDRLYTDISGSIAGAIVDIAELNVEHEQGKQEIGNMLHRLRTIQSRFDRQLGDLQQFAEWENLRSPSSVKRTPVKAP